MSALEWVRTNCTHRLSLDEARCIEVLCTIAAPYNLALIGEGWADWSTDLLDEAPHAVEFGARLVVVRLAHTQLATYDGNALTRLVLAAHERAVRVELSAEALDMYPSAQACLRIQLDARIHGAEQFYERHPNIEEATIAWRGSRIV